MRLIVIGGVAAGLSAASKAARLDASLLVDVYTDESYISYSGCSLPYYTQGVIDDEDLLIGRTKEEFAQQGISVHTQCSVKNIRPDEKAVWVKHPDDSYTWEAYDKLVIATGARPVIPGLPGIELPGIFTMKQIPDANAIRSIIQQNKAKQAVIVGGGFIGVEMAEALTAVGMEVTILEMAPQIMTLMDEDMASMIQTELEAHGVKVKVGTKVLAFEGVNKLEGVRTETELVPADLVILAIGVQPNSDIADKAGIELGVRGAIKVNSKMETNLPDIYAAGDCAVAHHLVIGQDAYVPLGTTANKQGRIAGENAAGGSKEFKGIIGTTIFKVMNCEGARTGLSKREAERYGMKVWESKISAHTRAAGYPGRGPLTIKLIIDQLTNQIVGGQIFGTEGAGKRIDLIAAMVQLKQTPEAMAALDLAYAPPFSPVWEPLLVAANQAVTKSKLK